MPLMRPAPIVLRRACRRSNPSTCPTRNAADSRRKAHADGFTAGVAGSAIFYQQSQKTREAIRRSVAAAIFLRSASPFRRRLSYQEADARRRSWRRVTERNCRAHPVTVRRVDGDRLPPAR